MTLSAQWPIVDTPNTHGMFMLGTKTLFLSHMPMFTKEDHHYQMTLRVRLDAASMAAYLADRAANPDAVYNLSNLGSDQFTLPELACGARTSYTASVYRGYSNDGGGTPGQVIIPSATVSVDRVVHYRAFDRTIPRPANLCYLVFGNETEAHLDHYISADPDFQHLLTLQARPDWLSPAQLAAGVLITFPLPGAQVPCTPPLPPGTHRVLFQGIAEAAVPIEVGATYWFSTGNMLNRVDPCASAGQGACGSPAILSARKAGS